MLISFIVHLVFPVPSFDKTSSYRNTGRPLQAYRFSRRPCSPRLLNDANVMGGPGLMFVSATGPVNMVTSTVTESGGVLVPSATLRNCRTANTPGARSGGDMGRGAHACSSAIIATPITTSATTLVRLVLIIVASLGL